MKLRGVEHVLLDLADSILARAGGAEEGVAIHVTRVDLDVPCEMRINARAGLDASMPRGRMATGFDPPLGQLRAVFLEDLALEGGDA
jgi:hypothetical protein